MNTNSRLLITVFFGIITSALVLSAPGVHALTYPGISAGNGLEWITNVTLNRINNTTGQDTNGYGDYTYGKSGMKTDVVAGKNYLLYVTIETGGFDYITVFFDWNQNGNFTDAGESVTVATNSNWNEHFINLTIPTDATLGETRMRVVLKYDSAPPSFGTIEAGEAEDYSIVVYPAISGNNSDLFITNVTFGAIDEDSGRDASGYVDSTYLTTDIQRGRVHPLSVTIFHFGFDYITAFIDWNQDGDFDDAGESIPVVTFTNSDGPHSVNITVPADAILGKTRMRIVLRWGPEPPSSGVIASGGEAEDYTVNITKFPWPMFLPCIINTRQP